MRRRVAPRPVYSCRVPDYSTLRSRHVRRPCRANNASVINRKPGTMKPPLCMPLRVDKIQRARGTETDNDKRSIRQLPGRENGEPAIDAEPRRIFVSARHAGGEPRRSRANSGATPKCDWSHSAS